MRGRPGGTSQFRTLLGKNQDSPIAWERDEIGKKASRANKNAYLKRNVQVGNRGMCDIIFSIDIKIPQTERRGVIRGGTVP